MVQPGASYECPERGPYAVLVWRGRGRVNRRALELMDGTSSLEQIARKLAAEFPQRFTRSQQALSYAAKRSQEHSR